MNFFITSLPGYSSVFWSLQSSFDLYNNLFPGCDWMKKNQKIREQTYMELRRKGHISLMQKGTKCYLKDPVVCFER